VVAALQQRGIATALHDEVSAMAADVDEGSQALVVAHDHHRHVAGEARDVVADLGELGERPDVVPALAEDLQHLLFDNRRIGVPARRQRFAAVERTEQIGAGFIGLCHAGRS
jgi:hypothetical protein